MLDVQGQHAKRSSCTSLFIKQCCSRGKFQALRDHVDITARSAAGYSEELRRLRRVKVLKAVTEDSNRRCQRQQPGIGASVGMFCSDAVLAELLVTPPPTANVEAIIQPQAGAF